MAVKVYPLLAHGVFSTYGYFVVDSASGNGLLVDPGAQPGLFADAAKRRGWNIGAIVLTHGHFDHMGAAGELQRHWNVPVMAHALAERYLLDPRLNLSARHGCAMTLPGTAAFEDGERIATAGGGAVLEVLHVPGHTDDSCVLYCEQGDFALVGDTVYEGGPGLTVFPTGDARKLHASIREKLLALPEHTTLLSGHSRPMTVSRLKAVMQR